MIKFLPCWLVAVAVFLRCAEPCQAQLVEQSGIQGNGTAIIERLPELLRVTVTFTTSGKNLPEALDKVKARRTKVEQQLQKLGAIKDSIKFGAPTLDGEQGNDQQRMQMMIQQRMMMQARGGKKPKKDTAPKPVPVSIKVTADWQLTAKDEIDLLLAGTKLQDAIKAADLGGTKETTEEKSAEDEELAEEMAEMQTDFGQGQTPKPGEPVFAYVARIPEKDREQSLAKAFDSARQSAERLARAAGLELGSLRSLQSTAATDTGNPAERYQMLYGVYGMAANQDETGAARPDEALSPALGMIRYRLAVSASFNAK